MVQNQNTNSCLSLAAKAPSVLCSHPLLLPGGLTFSHCGSQLLQHLKVGGGWKKSYIFVSHSLGIPVIYIHTENLLPF